MPLSEMALAAETNLNVSFLNPDEAATTPGELMGRKRVRSDRERGAALLEFVLVLPIFILFIYTAISLGMALTLKEDVTHAAAEGARAAIGASETTAATYCNAAGDVSGQALSPAPTSVPSAYTQPQQWCQAAWGRVYSVLNWLPNGEEAYLTPNISVATCPDGLNTCITVQLTYDYADHPIVPNIPLASFNPTTLNSTAILQVSND
jgi:hypothetical protein